MNTIETEDKYLIPFFTRTRVSVIRGRGAYFWDEEDKKYLDFTSGWGVTSLGHASPVITEALAEQSRQIIQTPNSGLYYTPARAGLLELLAGILPQGLTHIFFSNSGAEANDAAIKLARKVSGRKNVVSTNFSFHGRTISTMSATGQQKYLERFSPLMPGYKFVPYNDIPALAKVLDDDVAAFIVEPVQGEGGVNVPDPGYLAQVSQLCREKGVFLIADEVQTGFCRTGPMFASARPGVQVDFLTMAKGLGGGFPIGAFAVTKEIAARVEKGDHGGTYCGNPLGCAVAHAVINYLIKNEITKHVQDLYNIAMNAFRTWKKKYPALITEIRGAGLLLALEMAGEEQAVAVENGCMNNGLLVNRTQGKVIRLFPALNITAAEFKEGLVILGRALGEVNPST